MILYCLNKAHWDAILQWTDSVQTWDIITFTAEAIPIVFQWTMLLPQ